jgi:hypothetical protein
MVIQMMFITEEQLSIETPSAPEVPSELYIDGGAYFFFLFLGKQKKKNKNQ